MRIPSGRSSCLFVLESASHILRPRAKLRISFGTTCCDESVCALSKALIGIVLFDQIPVTLNRTSVRWLGGAGCDSNAEIFGSRLSMVLSYKFSIKVLVINITWLPPSSTRVILLSPMGPTIRTRAACR